jgi:hypothetical protein
LNLDDAREHAQWVAMFYDGCAPSPLGKKARWPVWLRQQLDEETMCGEKDQLGMQLTERHRREDC